MNFQDLTRHPEDGNGWQLWLSDALAGAGIIVLMVGAFVFTAVLFDTPDRPQPVTYQQR